MKDYFIFGLKNLKRRGVRSWLTLLGIFIGIAAVVSLIGLGNALKDTVNAQFGVSSTELITIQAGGLNSYGPPGTGVVNSLTKEDEKAIERLGRVEFTISRKIETLSVEFNNQVIFTAAGSIPGEGKEDRTYELADLKPEFGKLIYERDRGKIVLGNDFLYSEKNGFEKDIKVNDRVLIEGKEFRVAGFFENKGSFILNRAVAINERDLKELKNFGSDVDIILVKVRDKSFIDETKEDIERLLRQRRNVKEGEEDFEVSTPEAMLGTVNQVLMGVQIFIVIIASISIFVGAVGITNTMMTSVMERRKEIGIMKAVGARNENIFWQFFIEAGLLGAVGGILGILGGLGIGYLGVLAINDFLGTSTVLNLNFVFLLGVLIISFLVGSLSGVFPAMNAAKLNPVEALRK
jgi:putative ABC transport system permease protein